METMEIINVFRESRTGEVAAEKMSDFVNNFVFDKKGFFEEMLRQSKDIKERFTKVCLAWIKKLNYLGYKNWYDERNKYSILTAESIAEILKENSIFNGLGYNGCIKRSEVYNKNLPFEIEFAERMGEIHRTLQQSFSSIVFEWMYNLVDDVNKDYAEIGEAIKSNMDESFYRTPLI